MLQAFAPTNHKDLQVRASGMTSFSDFSAGPSVVIGGSETNQWSAVLAKGSRFQLARLNGRSVIGDRPTNEAVAPNLNLGTHRLCKNAPPPANRPRHLPGQLGIEELADPLPRGPLARRRGRAATPSDSRLVRHWTIPPEVTYDEVMVVTLDIPTEIEARLKAEALARGIPLSEFVGDFIIEYYQAEEDLRVVEARLNDPQPPISGAQMRMNLGLDS